MVEYRMKYPNVVKEGEKAMGGEILDYPAKIARREGREEGVKEERLNLIKGMLRKGKTAEEISELTDYDITEIREVEKSLVQMV